MYKTLTLDDYYFSKQKYPNLRAQEIHYLNEKLNTLIEERNAQNNLNVIKFLHKSIYNEINVCFQYYESFFKEQTIIVYLDSEFFTLNGYVNSLSNTFKLVEFKKIQDKNSREIAYLDEKDQNNPKAHIILNRIICHLNFMFKQVVDDIVHRPIIYASQP